MELSDSFESILTNDAPMIIDTAIDLMRDPECTSSIPFVSIAAAVYHIGKTVRERHHLEKLTEFIQEIAADTVDEEKRKQYTHAQPFTKESLLYREIFEKYYPGQAEMIADFWMPNRAWAGCDVNDPSARVLANYGESGV